MITLYFKQYNKIIRNADHKLLEGSEIEDILWIDLVNPTLKEQRAVESAMDITIQTRQEIEEIETSSKYVEAENYIVSNTNFFIPSKENVSTEPVSLIITKSGSLISVRTCEMRTFREAEKRMQMNPKSYPTGFHIFSSLFEVRIDYDADLVEHTAKMVSTLSRDIALEDIIDKEIILRIRSLQEDTMMLRENIFDRQRVLGLILRSDRFPKILQQRFKLMNNDVNSLLSHADFAFQRLDYLQDSALGLINIEQNEIVKIFSIAAVIFLPATLVASIYGMNFKYMPELDWAITLSNGAVIPVGYIFAIFMMIFTSCITIWYFKFKKWI